jgi:hypothetical protein
MGHSDKPGDGCGGGRRQCGGNLLVDPAFSSKEQRPEKDSVLRAVRALRRLMRQGSDTTRS